MQPMDKKYLAGWLAGWLAGGWLAGWLVGRPKVRSCIKTGSADPPSCADVSKAT